MTTQLKLSKQEFEREYHRKFLYEQIKNIEEIHPMHKNNLRRTQKKELETANFFYDLIKDNYNPDERKIALRKTCKTYLSRNSRIFERILEAFGGTLVEKLDEADTLVYWGASGFCEYKYANADSPIVLSPILSQIENKGKTGLIFQSGSPADVGCYPSKCPETKKLYELQGEGKDIHRFQLGMSNKSNILTFG